MDKVNKWRHPKLLINNQASPHPETKEYFYHFAIPIPNLCLIAQLEPNNNGSKDKIVKLNLYAPNIAMFSKKEFERREREGSMLHRSFSFLSL